MLSPLQSIGQEGGSERRIETQDNDADVILGVLPLRMRSNGSCHALHISILGIASLHSSLTTPPGIMSQAIRQEELVRSCTSAVPRCPDQSGNADGLAKYCPDQSGTAHGRQ